LGRSSVFRSIGIQLHKSNFSSKGSAGRASRLYREGRRFLRGSSIGRSRPAPLVLGRSSVFRSIGIQLHKSNFNHKGSAGRASRLHREGRRFLQGSSIGRSRPAPLVLGRSSVFRSIGIQLHISNFSSKGSAGRASRLHREGRRFNFRFFTL